MTTQTLRDIPELSIVRYLREDPHIGLLIHANNTLNLHLRPEFAKVAEVEGVGEDAVARIETFPSISDFIKQEHQGTLNLSYKRLHIADIVDRVYIRTTLPTTAWGIIQQIQKASGLVFRQEDIVNTEINSQTTEIFMADTSAFWFGSFTVYISEYESPPSLETEWIIDRPDPGPIEYDLADILTKQVLDGLRANPIPRIENMTPVDQLTGFDNLELIDLEEFIQPIVLDGLYIEDHKTELSAFINPTILDGLNIDKVELATFIDPIMLPGLELPIPPDLGDKIQNVNLDGFDPVLDTLTTVIENPNLSGFDPILNALEDVIQGAELDGFDPKT